jgi:hypothetical protein
MQQYFPHGFHCLIISCAFSIYSSIYNLAEQDALLGSEEVLERHVSLT